MSIFLNSTYGANKLTPRQILSDPILFLAFGFGSGLAKKAPGTMGTVAAIPVYWLFAQTNFIAYSVLTAIACIAGIWICGIAANKLAEHDFGGIVWDEVAIFGPKIGQGFLQNLMGKFDPVTIDLWMRRTWGRWTGDVVGTGITEDRMDAQLASKTFSVGYLMTFFSQPLRERISISAFSKSLSFVKVMVSPD